MSLDFRHRLPTLDDCEQLLTELVRRESPSGRERSVQEFICHWFAERGLKAELQTVADGLVNSVVRVEGAGPGPTLLFCGHVDTALPASGWETDPFAPTRQGDRLYGLGTMDMKGGVAAAMLTVAALAELRQFWRGTVIFAGVADEEAYSRGAKGLIAQGLKADGAILCEPSFPAADLGGVGKVLVDVQVIGKQAHGSHPQDGINAVIEAARLLTSLDRLPMQTHPLIGADSQCVLGIHGGPDEYVIQVPERCHFTINRHIVPGETDASVLADMEALVSTLQSPARFAVTIQPPYYPPYLVPSDAPFVRRFAEAYRAVLGREPEYTYSKGVSDGNYLVVDAAIPTVTFGPSGRNLHSANEYVNLPEIPVCVEVYLTLAGAMLV